MNATVGDAAIDAEQAAEQIGLSTLHKEVRFLDRFSVPRMTCFASYDGARCRLNV